MKAGLRPGTKAWQEGMRDLRLKQAAVARKALKATRAERTPEQVAKAAENRRARERARRKMAQVAKAVDAAAPAKKPHRTAAQIEEVKERKRERDRARYKREHTAIAGGNPPDAELTPEQLKKREDNRRYRAATKARAAAAAGSEAPPKRPSQSPEKQREYQARYQAKKRAANGNGHSEVQEMHFPLEAIPDRVPSSLRERGPSRAPSVATIGGFDANKLLILEVAKLFNRLLDTP